MSLYVMYACLENFTDRGARQATVHERVGHDCVRACTHTHTHTHTHAHTHTHTMSLHVMDYSCPFLPSTLQECEKSIPKI